jgi:hypothetical protein
MCIVKLGYCDRKLYVGTAELSKVFSTPTTSYRLKVDRYE